MGWCMGRYMDAWVCGGGGGVVVVGEVNKCMCILPGLVMLDLGSGAVLYCYSSDLFGKTLQ